MQNFIFNAQQPGRDQQRQAIISQIMGHGAQPQGVAQGAVQGLNSMMGGLALRKHDQGPFPSAPGGGRANPMQGLMNFFGRGGGLY